MVRNIKTKERCIGRAAPKTREGLRAAKGALVRAARTKEGRRGMTEGESAPEGDAAQDTVSLGSEAAGSGRALGASAAKRAMLRAGSGRASEGASSPAATRRGGAAVRPRKGRPRPRSSPPRGQARSAAGRMAREVVRRSAIAAGASVHAQGATGATGATGAKGAARAARSAKDAILAFARMAARALRSLQAAAALAGGTATAVVVVICIVGLIASSAFGIFFAGGDMGDGNPSLREVVARIDEDYAQRIEDAKAQSAADEVALTGSKASWSDVIAVLSVRCAHDPSNPMDVVTMDASRQSLLEETFWQMNAIETSVEQREVTEIKLSYADDGTPVESQETVVRTTLRINLVRKTAQEASELWAFTAEQRGILEELLDSDNAKLWQMVLHGAVDSGDIVEVAASQIGNAGGAPYWSWYGFSSRVEWCACFVSWCASECGYIEAGVIPKFSYCPSGVQWFREAGLWLPGGSEPSPGDIVFFDWNGDGTSDHVGIVESCDGATVRTIEGNSSDSCRRRSYSVTSSSILGYGTPMY